jgi:hypothetical protein
VRRKSATVVQKDAITGVTASQDALESVTVTAQGTTFTTVHLDQSHKIK